MSVDIQVIYPQSVINLNSIQVLAGMSPKTLDIQGQDFSAVDQVLINGIASPDVVIISKTRLLAQVPTALLATTLTSVTVTSLALTLTNKTLLKFQFGDTASKVSGILRLMQVFLKILFTTPGRDIFAPRIGGNGLGSLGLTFGKDDGGTIVSNFVIAVSNTQKQLVAIQSRDPSIPAVERLLSATVVQAGYNLSEGALAVGIEILSQSGKVGTANLVV